MRVSAERSIGFLAFLVVGIVVAVTIRNASYVAVLTDPAGYVGAAQRWLDRDLFRPVHFQLLPGWPHNADSGSALGFRASTISGTDVGEYPLGFPVFLAAITSVVGELGPYLAGPLFVALLAWCTYQLGFRLGGRWTGALAAFLIVISPVTVRHVIHPMSDVAATAFWALAWLMGLRFGIGASAAAGAAVTAAVMVRPNLAPLAMIIGLLIFATVDRPGWSWRRAIARAGVFGLFAAIGPCLVLWSQHVLYGSAFTPGYKGARDFFKWTHIADNLTLYPAWLSEVHTPIALIALAAVPLLWKRGMSADAKRARTILISALALITLNFAIYLPYLNFQQWTYLRFMLPAMTALFLILGAATVSLTRRLASRSRLLAPVAWLPVVIVFANGLPLVKEALASGPNEMRVLMMVRYLREVLPRNAVVLTSVHSGGIAHYTRRPIVRLDTVPPGLLDPVLSRLAIRGQMAVFVIDDALESRPFREYFTPSEFHTLDWAPRAEFSSPRAIWYMLPTDRAPYRAGARWPMDVLRWPLSPRQ